MKNFINGTEFTLSELKKIINMAIGFKNGTIAIPNLSGKILTLIFNNTSLRTKLSFESGMYKLNGKSNIISSTDTWDFEYEDSKIMNQNKQEHIKEAAKVIAAYSDIIGLRKSELITKESSSQTKQTWNMLKQDQAIKQLAKNSNKPIINMESNMFHPCQSLADMQTIVENLGKVKKKKYVLTWAPHPKPLPLATPHSQILTPNIFGMDVTLACPKGFELDPSVIELAESHGGKIKIEHDQKKAFKDADVIVAKSWASLKYFGKWEEEKKLRNKHSDWMVTQDKIDLSNNAIFLHCLPVRRNVVVHDRVLDGANSKILQQAENRMWTQMALVNKLINTK